MDKSELLKSLNNDLDTINNISTSLDIDSKKKKLEELKELSSRTDFWNDRERAESTISELTELKNTIEKVEGLKEEIVNNIELLKIIEKDDNSMLDEIEKSIKRIKDSLEELNTLVYLNGNYDKNNCILEINPGAGGTESCDWASMLYRMYTRWCEKHNYKIELLDYQAGEEAGIKKVTIMIKGPYAYGYLKKEKGIHRLVRLSPFDSNNRRHTSFAAVEVTPEIDNDIDIDLDEKDLKIDVYRSTGAGGQGVNTTDSAVRITHLPTKIVVTCQNQRSQIQNKEEALRVLKSKLLLLEEEKQEKELNSIKGEQLNIDFGSQIRSYVMHPYSMVKDHRTNVETSNVSKVMDGDIDLFIKSNLTKGV